ncbi:MAG: N-acetyltransferase [Chromatiales bacterium]|nr:N-acetyltransferase [Chromatiales bacterium]
MTRKLLGIQREFGWRNGAFYIFGEGLKHISRGFIRLIKYDFVAQPIRPALDLPIHRGRDILIQEVEQGNSLLQLIGHSREVLDFRFQQGAHCLLATRRGVLAGYLWYVEPRYLEDEVRCEFLPRPAESAVWDFDVYVAPNQRLTSTFSKLWDAAFRQLYPLGYRFTCCRISAFKPDSLAAHRQLGAQIVGSGIFLCIGSWQLSLIMPGFRWHLSLSGQSIPRVPVMAKPVC